MTALIERPYELRVIAGECPCCDGSGEEFVRMWPGTYYDPPEPEFDTCHHCDGTGAAEIEVYAIELEDLETIPNDDDPRNYPLATLCLSN